MYLCVCRAINERKVRAVVESGGETVGAVFRACGTAPQCGSCVNRMRAYVQETRAALAEEACDTWAVAAE